MNRKTLIITILIIIISHFLYPQKSPDEFFGFPIGADRTLVKYPEIIKYFKYINTESDRIHLVNEGLSTLKNPMYLAFISSERNISQLNDLIEINKKLANPDTISKEEAAALLEKAKTFVLVTCAIHATEIASTQMSMLFAHHLASSKNPEIMSYLDQVVILLMPSINPDGNIMVTDWYYRYVKSDYEGCRLPYLYHHYAGHDNNRDFYMLNLKETKVVNAILHHRYFPQIFLDLHQMGNTGPRMFVPPFKDPLNQNLDPVLLTETNMIGSMMSLRLQENNKQGVGSAYAFDAFWPGGSKNTAWYKNVVGILTEIASVKVATPIYIDPNELKASFKGLPEYKAQVNFPDPWPGGWWRLKDIIDYEMIAAEALLEIAAKNSTSFLKNFYQMGLRNLEKGKNEAPYGYLIPHKQWDQPALYSFLIRMQEHGIRIFRLEADVRAGNRIYKQGDFLIPMSQPYRNFVKVMMERQHYPEIKYMKDGPIIEPYDAVGWTLPIQMGIKSLELKSPLKDFAMKQVTDLTYPGGQITGEGNYYRIPGRFNRSVIVVNRLQKRRANIYRYTGKLSETTGIYPGDYLVKVPEVRQVYMEEVLEGTGVSVSRIQLEDSPDIKAVIKPEIGIYQSYRSSMDEGWTRWVLDKFEFSYDILKNKDFNEEELSRHHVIIFPDQPRETIVDGLSRGYWTFYPSSVPPEYRGGIGKKGVEALKQYVQNGGTIVLLDSAAELGVKDFALPFSIINDGKHKKLDCPGSLLRIKVDNENPIGWGMEKDNFLFFSNSPVLRTRLPEVKTVDRKVVAGFYPQGPHLLSGYLKDGHLLNGAVMIATFHYHQGNVIVLSGRVQHRAQTFGTFKFLFNSLFYPGIEK